MGTTPVYALPYPEAADPADVPVDVRELAERTEAVLDTVLDVQRYRGALTPAQFSALTGVADGDVVDLIADATAGIVWRFRYRAASASAYKWEFLGGPALLSEVPQDSACDGASYGGLAAPGPTVTLPRPGDYDVDIGMLAYTRAGGPAMTIFMSYDLGATPASDAVGISSTLVAGPSTTHNHLSTIRRRTATSAGTVLLAKYRSTNPPGGQVSSRYMSVSPVRIS